MNLPQRNKNPGNLEYRGQKESICSPEGRFALFDSDPAGWRALARQVDLYQKRGVTIRQFVEKYAPGVENDVEAYIAFLCSGLRAQEGDKLDFYSRYALVGLIAKKEGYFNE